MENIFSFEYPPTGVIRIVILDSRTGSLYFAVKDFVPLLPAANLEALKGCLFHGDRSLREPIVPVEQVLPLLKQSGMAAAKALATRLERDVLPEVKLLCGREYS